MKKFVVVLSVSVAGSVLFLTGCSKSQSGSGSGDRASKGIVTIITNTNVSISRPKTPSNGRISIITAGDAPAAGGPVDMKIKWRVGKQYNMQIEMDLASDMNLAGRAVQRGLKITQVFHYSPVKKLGNGAYQVRMEFDRQALDLTENSITIKIDTSKDPSDDVDNPLAPVAKGLRATLGAPLDFTIAANGTAEKVDGLDDFTNGIINAVPNPHHREIIDELFGADTLKQYGDFSGMLPRHPVKVGDKWTSTQDVKNPSGQMTVRTTYIFKNWEQHDGHNCMHILASGDIEGSGGADLTSDGATVKSQQGTIFGESWFDPYLGAFVEFDNEHDLTLEITSQKGATTQQVKRSMEITLQGIR